MKAPHRTRPAANVTHPFAPTLTTRQGSPMAAMCRSNPALA